MVKLTVILSIFVLAGAFAAFLIWGGGLLVSDDQPVVAPPTNPPPATVVPETTPVIGTVLQRNRPPNFGAGQVESRVIAEDAPEGTLVGLPIAATDPDGDWVRSHLNFESGEELEAFFAAFDYQKTSNGGRIVVAQDSNLDAATKSFYSVRVAIYDGKDAAGEPDLTDGNTTTDRNWVDAYFGLTIDVTKGNGTAGARYELKTSAVPTEGGIISPEGGVLYYEGQLVTVTAEPQGQWAFYGWAGGCASSGKRDDGSGWCNVEMDGERDVTAEFTPFAAPIDFQGTATSTSASLTWSIVGQFANAFNLIRRDLSAGDEVEIFVGGDDRSYLDEGLTPGTEYEYQLTNEDTPIRKSLPVVATLKTLIPPQSPSIISGSHHVCVLNESGSAYCWGLDDYGQATPPQDVVFASLSTGSLHTCGLTPAGSPVCWGRNENGESEPPTSETFVAISSGSGHTCALREDGTPVCWGKNTDRYGNTVGQATPPEGETFSIISSGGDHTCGIRLDDTMKCWGWNAFGQASPPDDDDITYLSTRSWWHTCALKEDGTAKCWGLNNWGQSNAPGDEVFVEVATGDVHSCGLRSDGTVRCWGSNSKWSGSPYYGQATPPEGIAFVSITAGYNHTCGLTADGIAHCWGDDSSGQGTADRFGTITTKGNSVCGLRLDGSMLCWGDDTHGQLSVPPVAGFTAVAGGGDFNCALGPVGNPTCWGIDLEGQLSAPANEQFVDVTTGSHHACGLRADGSVDCWGAQSSQRNPNWGQDNPPAGQRFKHITGGLVHMCGLHFDNTATCWGWGSSGQLEVPGGVEWLSISPGDRHTCGVTADGTAMCWGGNDHGQTEVPSGETFKQIVSGFYHTCGLRTDGTAVCWGGDGRGATEPPAGGTFVSLSAGAGITCGIRQNGSFTCWGRNDYGQLNRHDAIAKWSADGSARDVIDQYDGELMGDAGFANGLSGQAFDFRGSESFVRIPHDPHLIGEDELTVAMWVNLRSYPDHDHAGLANMWGPGWQEDDSWSLNLKPSGSVRFRVAGDDTATDNSEVNTNHQIELNEWVHVAAVYHRGEFVGVYFDDVRDDGGVRLGDDAIHVSDQDLWIGLNYEASSERTSLDGLVDEVMIFNRALTEAEIQELASGHGN